MQKLDVEEELEPSQDQPIGEQQQEEHEIKEMSHGSSEDELIRDEELIRDATVAARKFTSRSYKKRERMKKQTAKRC